jgi:transposase
LRSTPAQLRDALSTCTELNPVYRRLVKMALADLQFIEQQIDKLDQEIAGLLREHQDAVQRLAEVPGLGVDSAQPIIAEVGAKAATFASAKNLVSWVGAWPGRRRKRRREPQPTLAEGQPSNATHSQPGGPCCCETQREHL